MPDYLAIARQVEARLARNRDVVRDDPDEVARVLELPLDQLDSCLEVRVPWDSAPVWFVPSRAAFDMLVAEGIAPGLVWTAQELLEVLAIPGVMRDELRQLAEAKRLFDGEVTQQEDQAEGVL